MFRYFTTICIALTNLIALVSFADQLAAQIQTNISFGKFYKNEGGHLGTWVVDHQAIFGQDKLTKSQLDRIEQSGREFDRSCKNLKGPKQKPFDDKWGSEPPEVTDAKQKEWEKPMDDYFMKYRQISLKFHQDVLDILSHSQKRRVAQALWQLKGAGAWPFSYFKKKEFVRAAKLDSLQQKEFNTYLFDVTWTDFNKRVNKLVQQHRAQVLNVLSDETKARLIDLVGPQRTVKLIPMIRKESMFRHPFLHGLDDRLMTNPVNKQHYDAWSVLLMNSLVASELEWLDEQHQKHLEIVAACQHVYHRIPRPRGERFQVGENTWRELLDQADVDAYKAKVKANYKKHHEQRLKLLVDHQKKQLREVLRQCAGMKTSVLRYLGEERTLAFAKATSAEKTAIRKALKIEEKKLLHTIQKMIAKQTDAVYQRLPENRRVELQEMIGEPLEFTLVPALAYHNYYLDPAKYRELQKAKTGRMPRGGKRKKR